MNFITISDLSDERVNIYMETSENRLYRYFEPEPGIFIVESAKVIERALKAGFSPISMLINETLLHSESRELINQMDGVPIYQVPDEIYKGIRGFSITNGCMCAFRRKVSEKLSDFLDGAYNIAVLEDVENPTNVGAIFRSAAALGIDGIVLTKGSADPLYRRASRVSMGTVFSIPWIYTEEENYLDVLHSKGFTSIALALRNDSISIADEKIKAADKKAILLGNEGNGLTKSTIEGCSFKAIIPMFRDVDSLNVSNAAAITFWELMGKENK